MRLLLSLLLFLTLSQTTSAQLLSPYLMPEAESNLIPGMSWQGDTTARFSVRLPVWQNSELNTLNLRSYYITNQAGKQILDLTKMAADVKEKGNYIYNRFGVNPIGFSYRKGNFQVGFNYGIKEYLYFGYNGDAVRVPVEGNADRIGETISFGISADAGAYHEIALTGSYRLKNKWLFGVNLKYLNGIANGSTTRNKVEITTDADAFQLHLFSDLEVNTSNLPRLTVDSLEVTSEDFNGIKYGFSSNHGLAIDLGASYRLNEKWTFGAHLLDLGFVRWKSYTTNYNSNIDLRFDGVDIKQVIFGDTLDVQALVDSLALKLNPTITQNAYTTSLAAQAALTAEYAINEKWSANMLIHAAFQRERIMPSVAVGAKYTFCKYAKAGFTLAYSNNVSNVGLNFTTRLGPVQLFAATDNVIGLFQYSKGHQFRAMAGATILIK